MGGELMFNKKYLKTIIFAAILSIEVIGLTGCNSSKKEIKIPVTVGEYPNSQNTVRLENGDAVEDIEDIGDGWIKFKSNGKTLTCPKDKLERSY